MLDVKMWAGEREIDLLDHGAIEPDQGNHDIGIEQVFT